MKKSASLFILFWIINSLCVNYAATQVSSPDSVFINIQDNIYEAFLESFSDNNTGKLEALQKQLDSLNSDNQVLLYWIPYSKYYESIFYLKMGNQMKAKEAINEGIELLSQIEDKNSETYALLAHLISFSIQFEKGMLMMTKAKLVEEYGNDAIKLNPGNLRGWYVLAANDFYKPEEYGGRKKCEEYLLKAIDLNQKNIPSSYRPTWGLSDSYNLLVKFYIESEKKDLAKQYLEEGLELFPDDYMLNQSAQLLEQE